MQPDQLRRAAELGENKTWHGVHNDITALAAMLAALLRHEADKEEERRSKP